MLQKIESYIAQHHMIEKGSHVIAGVSGGADSVCLLRVLLALRSRLCFTVSVVHVEHGIRGEQSVLDAQFVEALAAAHGVACSVYACDVPSYASSHGMSEEEAGRLLRYRSFSDEKKKYACRSVKIAVAHNRNDNAETMLFHLARGTGLGGLSGISPVRGDIIRPLLCIGRAEIERYLGTLGQAYCTDATNGQDLYSRNRIRHAVLPQLMEINSRADCHMYETAQYLRELDGYITRQARSALISCTRKKTGGVELLGDAFFRSEPVLRAELLHLLLVQEAGSSKDITKEHIVLLQGLFGKTTGKRVDLPYGLSARRTYDGVFVFHRNYVENKEKTGETCGKEQFSFKIYENSEPKQQISKKKYTKCFDYDKIKVGFCVRGRQPGDYLVINDAGERQKLKKYLVNEKIPANERERLMLLADGPHIMWIVGHRISSYYKVDEQTVHILEVTFYGGEEDE